MFIVTDFCPERHIARDREGRKGIALFYKTTEIARTRKKCLSQPVRGSDATVSEKKRKGKTISQRNIRGVKEREVYRQRFHCKEGNVYENDRFGGKHGL